MFSSCTEPQECCCEQSEQQQTCFLKVIVESSSISKNLVDLLAFHEAAVKGWVVLAAGGCGFVWPFTCITTHPRYEYIEQILEPFGIWNAIRVKK